MTNIRITKQFNFEAAHSLHGYNGLCKHIHGHSYVLYVTVIGKIIQDKKNPKYGMVMDFSELKKIVKTEIVNKLDHALLIWKESDNKFIDFENNMFKKTIITDYQPTCENMVNDFANRLKTLLPDNVELYSIKLHETATSFAEWYSIDNEN